MNVDPERWVGRREVARDIASARQVAGLAALFDRPAPLGRPGMVPPLGHWLYFVPDVPQGLIGPDGHPRQGEGLIPETGLPRRMWAASRVSFVADIPLGAAMERRSAVVGAKRRAGRSGELLFLTLQHDLLAEDRLAVREEQDIVYRAPPEPGAVAPTPEPAPVMAETRTLVLDPVQLFRFSALTFNAHRIHYDRDYAVDKEGYSGLVVQGPYVAMLLMDHFLRSRPGRQPRGFSFRGVAPLYDGETVTLGLTAREGGCDLAAVGGDGRLTMKAAVEG